MRSISFNAGRHAQVWVKNCIVVGLASNFIEPLEATSLDTVGLQLRALKEVINHFFTYNENSVAMYNDSLSAGVDAISYFIYLHYLTKRSDTEFWKTFKQRHPPPQKFAGILTLLYENNLRQGNLLSLDPQGGIFGMHNYIEIANGLGLFKQPMDMYGYENLTPSVERYKKWVDATIIDPTSVTSCTDFLAGLYGPEYVESPLRYRSGIPKDFCHCLCEEEHYAKDRV